MENFLFFVFFLLVFPFLVLLFVLFEPDLLKSEKTLVNEKIITLQTEFGHLEEDLDVELLAKLAFLLLLAFVALIGLSRDRSGVEGGSLALPSGENVSLYKSSDFYR